MYKRQVYNHPEFKSKSLGKIEGLDIVGNDIIKFLETSPNTFFLATRKKLYKIKSNRAECLLQFSNTKEQNNITSLYYSALSCYCCLLYTSRCV